MLPTLFIQNPQNVSAADFMYHSDFPKREPFLAKIKNIYNYFICEFMVTTLFTFADIKSAFLNTILHVFFMGAKKKMIGVYTSWVVAFVANLNLSVIYIKTQIIICYKAANLIFLVFNFNNSVRMRRVFNTAGPLNAPILSLGAHLFNSVLNFRYVGKEGFIVGYHMLSISKMVISATTYRGAASNALNSEVALVQVLN